MIVFKLSSRLTAWLEVLEKQEIIAFYDQKIILYL